MNFNDALVAHTNWKNRIKSFIDHQEPLDAIAVAKDNNCDLGKWIYGEGAKYSSLPEFQVVKTKHAQFHQTAAETIRKASGLPKDEALALLGFGSAYSSASAGCVHAISELQARVEKS